MHDNKIRDCNHMIDMINTNQNQLGLTEVQKIAGASKPISDYRHYP